MSLNIPVKQSKLSHKLPGARYFDSSVLFLVPVNGPGQSMGRPQHMQTSRQPVWPSASPLLVQLVTNDGELAAKYLRRPVIDPEAGTCVKLLLARCIRDEHRPGG